MESALRSRISPGKFLPWKLYFLYRLEYYRKVKIDAGAQARIPQRDRS